MQKAVFTVPSKTSEKFKNWHFGFNSKPVTLEIYFVYLFFFFFPKALV